MGRKNLPPSSPMATLGIRLLPVFVSCRKAQHHRKYFQQIHYLVFFSSSSSSSFSIETGMLICNFAVTHQITVISIDSQKLAV